LVNCDALTFAEKGEFCKLWLWLLFEELKTGIVCMNVLALEERDCEEKIPGDIDATDWRSGLNSWVDWCKPFNALFDTCLGSAGKATEVVKVLLRELDLDDVRGKEVLE